MSTIYFRVPHYVASYIRNRDPNNRVALGDVLYKGNIENVMHIIKEGLFFNSDERVMKNGCFCERQWNKMLHGYNIYGPSRMKILQPKLDSNVLTDAEIRMLAGIDYGKGGSDGEYLRMPIPEEVLMPDGKVHRTNKNYQLYNSAAEELRSHLTKDFKRALFDFMEREKDMAQVEGINRTVIDSLERFMACYDIRNGANNQERSALKRSYYRWRADKSINPDDYIDHA